MAERMRYFTKETLREACEAASMHDFNQTISREALASLPPGGMYPVLIAQPHAGGARASGGVSDASHNDPHLRCMVQMPDGILRQDTLQSLYDRLPFVKID